MINVTSSKNKTKQNLDLAAGSRSQWFYVNQANRELGELHSSLADIFYSTVPGAKLDEYRRWLWSQIKLGNKGVIRELGAIIFMSKKADVTLVCSCQHSKDNTVCHAHIIKKAVMSDTVQKMVIAQWKSNL